MTSVVFLLAIVWLGLVLDDEFSLSRGDLPLRLAAAVVLGSLVGTWLVFLLAWCLGFHLGTILGATGLILLFDLASWRRGRDRAWFRRLLSLDREFWRSFGPLVVLITAAFVFGVWRNADGDILFRGNFTDMGFHMGTVSAFLEQSAFPPFNPQSAGAKLSYHFMSDFFAAILCRGGFSLFYSLKVPMVLWAFALGSLACSVFSVVLRHRVAAICASVLFFLGHIGVFNLAFGLAGYPVGNGALTPLSWDSLEDHLTFPYFNFLNVLVDYFQPQLPFLFGFPLAALLLLFLFRQFVHREPAGRSNYFALGLVAFLPLFHMHTFLVLAPLVVLALATGRTVPAEPPGGPGGGPASSAPGRAPRWTGLWRQGWRPRSVLIMAATLLLAGAVILLQFAFLLSQPKAAGFSGFDVPARLGALAEIPDFLHAQRLWFWIRAAGPPFILGLAGFALPSNLRCRARDPDGRSRLALLILFVVTSGYFVLINFYRFTPSWGDSNKLFLYWDLVLCLYAGRLLAGWWERSRFGRGAAVSALLLGAVLPSAVEIGVRFWRPPSVLFTAGDQVAADWIRLNTPPDAIFLTANSYLHYVPALAGRRVVNGAYTRETGFADASVEKTVARAFQEADPQLITALRVTHIMVGPDEREHYHINRTLLARRHRLVFEQVSRGQRYSVYEARVITPAARAREREEEAARGFVWLSELDPDSVTQFGALRFDESFDMGPLTLAGKVYASGLGTHAPSEIRYELGGRYAAFEAELGLDDSQLGGPGSIVFKIEVDGRVAFTSGLRTAGLPPLPVRVDVADAQTLRLLVEDAGDGNHCDHADWAGARLIKKR